MEPRSPALQADSLLSEPTVLYSRSLLVIYFIYSSVTFYYWLIIKDKHEQSDTQDKAQKGPKCRSFCSHGVWSLVPSQYMDELINLEAL